jgi:hypothetical protein
MTGMGAGDSVLLCRGGVWRQNGAISSNRWNNQVCTAGSTLYQTNSLTSFELHLALLQITHQLGVAALNQKLLPQVLFLQPMKELNNENRNKQSCCDRKWRKNDAAIWLHIQKPSF